MLLVVHKTHSEMILFKLFSRFMLHTGDFCDTICFNGTANTYQRPSQGTPFFNNLDESSTHYIHIVMCWRVQLSALVIGFLIELKYLLRRIKMEMQPKHLEIIRNGVTPNDTALRSLVKPLES